MGLPLVVQVVGVRELLLHVAGEDRSCSGIDSNRHLEQEGLVRGYSGSSELLGVDLEEVGVFQESASESSEHQNMLAVSLDDTAALSLREY